MPSLEEVLQQLQQKNRMPQQDTSGMQVRGYGGQMPQPAGLGAEYRQPNMVPEGQMQGLMQGRDPRLQQRPASVEDFIRLLGG